MNNKLRTFMIGRYGIDDLYKVLYTTSIENVKKLDLPISKIFGNRIEIFL